MGAAVSLPTANGHPSASPASELRGFTPVVPGVFEMPFLKSMESHHGRQLGACPHEPNVRAAATRTRIYNVPSPP